MDLIISTNMDLIIPNYIDLELNKVYFNYFMKMYKKELDGLPEEICYKIFKMYKTYFGFIHEFYRNVISNCHCGSIYPKPEIDGYTLSLRFAMRELEKYMLPERPEIIYKTAIFITFENLSNTSIKTIQNMIYLYDMYYQKYKEIENQMRKKNYHFIFELKRKHKRSLDTLSDDELANYYTYKYIYGKYRTGKYLYFLDYENGIHCQPIYNPGLYLTNFYRAESYNNRKNIIRTNDGGIYFFLPYYECYKIISEIKKSKIRENEEY
jgi:hypothetical protein